MDKENVSMVSNGQSVVIQSRSTSPVKCVLRNSMRECLLRLYPHRTMNPALHSLEVLPFFRQFEADIGIPILLEPDVDFLKTVANKSPEERMDLGVLVEMARDFREMKKVMQNVMTPLSDRMTIDDAIFEEKSYIKQSSTRSVLISTTSTPRDQRDVPRQFKRISARQVKERRREMLDREEPLPASENFLDQMGTDFFTPDRFDESEKNFAISKSVQPMSNAFTSPNYFQSSSPLKASPMRGRGPISHSPSHITHLSTGSIDVSQISHSSYHEDDNQHTLTRLPQQHTTTVADANNTATLDNQYHQINQLKLIINERNRSIAEHQEKTELERDRAQYEVDELTHNLKTVKLELTQKSRQLSDMTQKLRSGDQELRESDDYVEKLRAEIKGLRLDLIKMNSEQDKSEDSVRQLLETIQRLEAELALCKKSYEDLRLDNIKLIEEINVLDQCEQEAREQLLASEQALADFEALKQDHEQLSLSCEQMREEFEGMKGRIEENQTRPMSPGQIIHGETPLDLPMISPSDIQGQGHAESNNVDAYRKQAREAMKLYDKERRLRQVAEMDLKRINLQEDGLMTEATSDYEALLTRFTSLEESYRNVVQKNEALNSIHIDGMAKSVSSHHQSGVGSQTLDLKSRVSYKPFQHHALIQTTKPCAADAVIQTHESIETRQADNEFMENLARRCHNLESRGKGMLTNIDFDGIISYIADLEAHVNEADELKVAIKRDVANTHERFNQTSETFCLVKQTQAQTRLAVEQVRGEIEMVFAENQTLCHSNEVLKQQVEELASKGMASLGFDYVNNRPRKAFSEETLVDKSDHVEESYTWSDGEQQDFIGSLDVRQKRLAKHAVSSTCSQTLCSSLVSSPSSAPTTWATRLRLVPWVMGYTLVTFLLGAFIFSVLNEYVISQLSEFVDVDKDQYYLSLNFGVGDRVLERVAGWVELHYGLGIGGFQKPI